MENKRTYEKGLWAERFAAFCLVLKGYRVLCMRYKTHVGEVDIVAQRGKSLAFCEVKYRSDYDAGLFSISPQSQQRIKRAAELYLAKEGVEQSCDIRFDAIIISPPFYMKHLRNAWTS